MITALLHDEMKSFEDLALNFALKELAHRKEVCDRYPFCPFDNTVLAKAHELGFLGITLPEDLGGIGQGISTLCVVLESICRTDASLGAIIFTNALAQEIILRSGSGELLREPASQGALIGIFRIQRSGRAQGSPPGGKREEGVYALGPGQLRRPCPDCSACPDPGKDIRPGGVFILSGEPVSPRR